MSYILKLLDIFLRYATKQKSWGLCEDGDELLVKQKCDFEPLVNKSLL